MMSKRKVLMGLIFSGVSIFLIGCSEDDSGDSVDNFDRQAMLANWADNIIIPGYQAYVSSLNDLNTSANEFVVDPTVDNLNGLRASWLSANLSWQAVGFFEIGKAEEITLINYTNIYPTNTSDMIATIESGNYDLTSVNKQDEQGFPAIEYLIYGVRATDQEIVDLFLEETTSSLYSTFLTDLTGRLSSLAQIVLNDWENGYRDAFVNNSGSESTSSVNKLVNDYLFYYEKHLRAGKIGIPAGVFAGSKLPEKVEGLYSQKSKELYSAGFDAMRDFFNGQSASGQGESLNSYLEFVNTISDGEDLSQTINLQFDLAQAKANLLSDDFRAQVENENTLMLETYDELQKNVVNMKVDMFQALNIRVDFVDADGD